MVVGESEDSDEEPAVESCGSPESLVRFAGRVSGASDMVVEAETT